MARKPLIDPNVLNQGQSTPLSTISRIIQKDREAGGRAAPEEAANQLTSEQVNNQAEEPSPELASPPVNKPTGEPGNQTTDEPVTSLASERVSPPVNKSTRKQVNQTTSEPVNKLTGKDRRKRAEETVEALAQTPAKQIGPRIPAGWDDWLEDYVHARRNTGLQKQDLIRTLIREFIVSEIAKQDGDE